MSNSTEHGTSCHSAADERKEHRPPFSNIRRSGRQFAKRDANAGIFDCC